MPPKRNRFIGPLPQGQAKAGKREWNLIRKARKAQKKARKAKGKAKAQAKAFVQMKQPAHHSNIQLPIGSAGQTMISAKWPQVYVKRGGKGGDNSMRFCVPVARYGCDNGASPGSAGISYLGTTAKFTQMLTIGPGWSLNTPGSGVEKFDQMLWLNTQLGYAAIQYAKYKMRRLKFHFVPSTATTASARAMWAAFFPDPAIACTEAKSAGTFALTTIQSASNAICFPAWQKSTLVADHRQGWLATNQAFADASSAETGPSLYAMVSSYFELHSCGTLAVVIDYTNSGGAVILDGYIFAEGEVEFSEPSPQIVNLAAPTVDGRRTAQLKRCDQKEEQKTVDPATILDPRVPRGAPLPLGMTREAYIDYLTKQLSELSGDDLQVVVQEEVKTR